MKVVNDSNNLTKHITSECRCDFGGRVCDLRQKIEKDKCQCDSKTIAHTKKIMSGIIVHVYASVIRIMKLVNT